MWVAFIIIGRELLVMGLRGAVTAGDGTVIRPSIWGKLKANVQFIAIFLAIWRPDVMIGDWYLDQVVMAIAAVITVASAVEYFARYGGALPWPAAPDASEARESADLRGRRLRHRWIGVRRRSARATPGR